MSALLRCCIAAVVVVVAGLANDVRAADPAPVITIAVNEKIEVKAFSKEDLRNLYLGKTTFWPGNLKVTAYDRPIDRPAGQAFYRDVLKMVPARFRHHWQSKQLSGQGAAPEALATADDVVARVAGNPGGIGYFLADEAPKTLPKGVTLVVVPAGD